MLEGKLQIPGFMQTIVAGSKELIDSDEVPPEGVTLLRRDPPIIGTEAFLESMVYCRDWQEGLIFRRFHQFDSYEAWPAEKGDLLSWAMNFRDMKNTPFSVSSFLECMDVWLAENDGRKGQHPAGFVSEVTELQTFLETQCFSPSLLQPYQETYRHNDDMEWPFFIIGRLRSSPQALLVVCGHLNCWI